jgi:hypothetical protein
MGNLVFQATLGGQVNLVGPNTASTFNLNVPAVSATLATTAANTFTAVQTLTAGSASAPALTTTGDTNTGIFFPAADTIAFAEGGTEAMRLDSAGNMGLGVTPSAWSSGIKAAQIGLGACVFGSTSSYNNTNVTANMFYNSGGSPIYQGSDFASFYQQVSGSHRWFNAPSGTAGNAISFTQAMTLDASGNLGVGTTSPTQKITANGSIRLTGNSSNFNETGAQMDSYDGLRLASYISTGSAIQFLTNASGGNTAERARIDSSGNLLVGKTAPNSSVVGWECKPTGEFSATMSASTNSTVTNYVFSTGAGAARFYIGMGGTVYATSTTITGISDQRLKENIRDLDDGLDVVMALQPRKFDWKEGKGKGIANDRGFIAQEFEQVLPDMVEEWRDPAPEGEEPYKAVNANLIPTLVKAIQEQQAIIETLTNRITALEQA